LFVTTWNRIDHVLLCIPEGEEATSRAVEFYSEVLGLDKLEKPYTGEKSNTLWFGGDGVEIHLGPEPDNGTRSRRHSAFEVDDLTEVQERLEDADIDLIEEPSIPGRTRFSFRDPFGNRIELLAYE
jgi:catechol 2,3-dioxygenase-like lactoylglutathione lyase family enzyme